MENTLSHLETARLRLRPFEEKDRPLALAIASDPGTTRYLYFWGRIGTTPEQDADRFLSYALQGWKESPLRAREYCAVLRETGEAIGDGSIEWVKKGVAEVGWILLPAYRGQGLAVEMGKALVEAGFQALGAETVVAHCDERNLPSRQVMERLGMTLSRVEPGARPAKAPNEENGSECTYALTRTDWEKRAQ